MLSPSRRTIISVNSPPITTSNLPTASSLGSPTAKQPLVFLVEERRRTFHIQSDIPPDQLDAQTLSALLGSVAETDNISSDMTIQPTPGSAQSNTNVKVQRIDTELAAYSNRRDEARESMASPWSGPRHSVYGPRRSLRKSTFTPALSPPEPLPRARSSQYPKTREKILFYHKEDPHYGFTNFSTHPVIYNGKRYPTSEHLFQSFKFHQHRPDLAEHIRTCSERPSVAFSEARRFQPEVRPDWKQVNVEKMDETLFYKFTQNKDLQEELLATGDAELIEDSDKDAFWGVGADRRGRNELGKCLERLRGILRGDGN